jgi:two-component system OmpR family sensor kinase
MSLRARLVAVLLALAAVGLVTVAAVTYARQRSSLMERTDGQLVSAGLIAGRALDEAGATIPGTPGPLRGGAGGPRRGAGPAFDLPPGTFAQRRDASGRPIKPNVVLSYGQKAPAPPKLPAHLALGKPITVGSTGDSSLRYRVRAGSRPGQPGLTIVAIPLRGVDQTLSSLLEVEALVVGAVLATLAALAWWLVGLGLRPLDRMGATAGAIAAGDLSRRVSPATERTEVGRLGLALNAMLGQIEKAFAAREASEGRLRRFLADASHELRTPLAAIRGYAELFRLGAVRDPDRAAKSAQRIEEEAARMGQLVENLLTLARLDQLPEAARAPVDLTGLAADAVEDGRAAAPDRDMTFEHDGAVSVTGDASQLRQVIANLVTNALVHTPAGTSVEISVEPEGDRAKLEVRDHGNGLPVADPSELFERFWRADPGRERGPGGAGLGLSIVAAIVAAHGGSVTAANAPGGGAAFTVYLPRA